MDSREGSLEESDEEDEEEGDGTGEGWKSRTMGEEGSTDAPIQMPQPKHMGHDTGCL